MKTHIQKLIQQALTRLKEKKEIEESVAIVVQVDRPKDSSHGDFASNIALVLAKAIGSNPRQLSQRIVENIAPSDYIQKIEIAGPGFINFTLSEESVFDIVGQILKAGKNFGRSLAGAGKKIHLEFVSKNPTGPLHVGHGRSAAYGACVANLLDQVGYQVHREYYVNDAGRQVRILAVSVWLRYLEHHQEKVFFPPNAYQGEYFSVIARDLDQKYQAQFLKSSFQLKALLPTKDETKDEEAYQEYYLDELINAAIILLGSENFGLIRQFALEKILADIKEDLTEFGIEFDQWFYETQLFELGMVDEVIALLKKNGHTYERDGALWLSAVALGDEKDRVLIRKDGHPTYFAPDIAYHLYKYTQGYDKVINILGADHHGYIPRIRASLKGLGEDPKRLEILLVQFAVLYRGKTRISMSTRSGELVTLRELRQEVGNDAARYFYIMRKPEQHLDFDLELAKSESNENPVYYIQYAHARICSVWRQLKEMDKAWDQVEGLSHLNKLTSEPEKQLMHILANYPETIENAALQYEPHLLAYYLQQLAHQFHNYYNNERFLVEEKELRNARLCLVAATQQVLQNGLNTLGLSTPEIM